MLPLEAKTYFDSLMSAASADAWCELANKQKEFERGEFARGIQPDGSGFAARLSELYKASFSTHARAISETLKTVHTSFNSPLDDDVEAQLLNWGEHALAAAYEGLEGAYMRHLQSFGIQQVPPSGMEHAYALAHVTVANLARRYLWELRNVPSKRPHQPAALNPVQQNIYNSGTIGALQTGAGSTATVEQQWIGGDTSELRAALSALREALERSEDVDPEERRELVADLDDAAAELKQTRPNKGKLLRWLGGVGTVVGALASVQPAYDAVRSLARALGLSL